MLNKLMSVGNRKAWHPFLYVYLLMLALTIASCSAGDREPVEVSILYLRSATLENLCVDWGGNWEKPG
jgi:hypothetical protein